MKNKSYKEIGFALVIVGLLVLLFNPFYWWMPSTMDMLLLLLLVLLSAGFMIFVWREHGGDEREEFHKLMADRVALLATAGVLTVALLVQGLRHTLDPWLGVALGMLIVAKLIGIVYSQIHH